MKQLFRLRFVFGSQSEILIFQFSIKNRLSDNQIGGFCLKIGRRKQVVRFFKIIFKNIFVSQKIIHIFAAHFGITPR
jgi:hypothetical protein